jgi:hypothetical protein
MVLVENLPPSFFCKRAAGREWARVLALARLDTIGEPNS